MATNSVLENLRSQWNQVHNLSSHVSNKPKQKVVKTKSKIQKTQWEHICGVCREPIIHDVLFINDFTGRYIAIEKDTMKPHKHKRNTMSA